jgi:glycosyltransferase involved in cell wall biosynthesis
MARILMITPSYFPKVGGVEKHVWNAAHHLKKSGWHIQILTEQFSGLLPAETKKGISIHRFSYPHERFLGLFYIWWVLLTHYVRLILAADIIHIHDVFIWYLPLRLLFFWKPVITTFHGWEGVYPVPQKNILIRKISALLSSKTVAIGKYLEKYYRFRANEIIYGAVEIPDTTSRKEPLLLFVGRLEYDTGLPVLLQALQRGAWKGKVIFCGDGLLREQAALLGEVKGWTDPRPYLKKASVVFAGGYLSVLEAFAYRAAVVAAEENPLKKSYYALAPFSEWLYVVNNPADLSRRLSVVSRNTKEVRQHRQKAFEWVRKQTWPSLAKRYAALYQVLL